VQRSVAQRPVSLGSVRVGAVRVGAVRLDFGGLRAVRLGTVCFRAVGVRTVRVGSLGRYALGAERPERSHRTERSELGLRLPRARRVLDERVPDLPRDAPAQEVRRRRAVTLARLKEEAAIAVRDLVRSGGDPSPERRRALAAALAPSSEEELFALGRHTPQLRPDIRENVLAALGRAIEDELRAIEKGGPAHLELMDRDRCCGG
jgi:hypothetical protein